HLARLRTDGRVVADIGECGNDPDSLWAAEARTVAAMAEGAQVVYQATFFDGLWRGHADFLLRVDRPGGRWPWTYDVADAKLARRPTGRALLQLCAYAEQVERVQGAPVEHLHVICG